MFACAVARAVASSLLEMLHSHGGDGRTRRYAGLVGCVAEQGIGSARVVSVLIFTPVFFLPLSSTTKVGGVCFVCVFNVSTLKTHVVICSEGHQHTQMMREVKDV